MTWLSATARLGADPKNIPTRTGTTMVVAWAYVDVEDDSGLGINLTGFSRLADELKRYRRGDAVRVSGKLQRRKYEKDGEERESLQLVLDGLAGTKRASPIFAEPKRPPQQKTTPLPFDDALPEF